MPKTTTTTANHNDRHDDSKDDNSSTSSPHYLMWFRRDLRIHDNTALAALCERANDNDASVSAVMFLTPEQWHAHDMSVLQVDHIVRTLPILARDVQKQLNITLTVYLCSQFEDCIDAMSELCEKQGISCVMANHEYEGREIARDNQLSQRLAENDIEFVRWHDQCLLPPGSITTNDNDSMYKVFTPFYKKWRDTLEAATIESHEPKKVLAKLNTTHPIILTSAQDVATTSDSIEKLAEGVVKNYKAFSQTNINNNPDSHSHTDIDTELKNTQLQAARDAYPAGEVTACHRLDQFVADDINDYNVSRDVPSLHATSQLSAYLTIGAISPRLCYLQAIKAQASLHGNDGDNDDINRWISELAWRDFYRHVLMDKPALIRHQAYKEDTDKKINWSYNDEEFEAWCSGKTGVPLVDAAMRCLNAIGFMHNRLRMVTAMFLTKDLLIDWRWGERYFMQQLIDGDFASNNGGWQWSASTGTDAAPYFRIMNPFSQAKSHDPDAIFIKTWLPELKDVPTSVLHSEDKMRKELVKGGKFAKTEYPSPMVVHKTARQLAIAEFKKD